MRIGLPRPPAILSADGTLIIDGDEFIDCHADWSCESGMHRQLDSGRTQFDDSVVVGVRKNEVSVTVERASSGNVKP